MKKILLLLSVLGLIAGVLAVAAKKLNLISFGKDKQTECIEDKNIIVLDMSDEVYEEVSDLKQDSLSAINNRHYEVCEIMQSSLDEIYRENETMSESNDDNADGDAMLINQELDSISDDLDNLLI